MSKNAKILISLIIIALILVIYLIVSSNKVSVAPENKKEPIKVNQVDLLEMKNEYQSNVKNIFVELENIYKISESGGKATGSKEKLNATSSDSAKSGNKLVSSLIGLRERLINLKVPEEYKNLHLNLVLLIDKLELYFQNGQAGDEQKSNEILRKVKIDNPWLSS